MSNHVLDRDAVAAAEEQARQRQKQLELQQRQQHAQARAQQAHQQAQPHAQRTAQPQQPQPTQQRAQAAPIHQGPIGQAPPQQQVQSIPVQQRPARPTVQQQPTQHANQQQAPKLNYPLDLSFKILALASQIYVRDSSGGLLLYVKQKMFKLKEAVKLYADEQQTNLQYEINADRVIDFSAAYTFTDAQGNTVGSVRRKGMKSLWKAHYQIFNGDVEEMVIEEENGWVKVIDAVIGGIPIVGMFTGYMFNPTYLIKKGDRTVMKVKKMPAFFEGGFQIENVAPLSPDEERRAILGSLMMVLLERGRG